MLIVQVEKEWRRKEKALAEKRLKDEEDLRIARERQIDDIRRLKAVEIQRDKEDFYKIIQVQKQLHQVELQFYGECA